MASVEELLEFRGRVSSLPGPGDVVGAFRLEAEIGRGGSGVVFRARDVELGREVALKLLPLDLSDDGEAGERRFQSEVSALASLRHPNIVEIYSAGTERGFRYCAMRLVKGCTLADRMAQHVAGSLPDDVLAVGWRDYTLRVVADVASALAAAHERGLVHRDVKPENILIEASGKGLLVDFGLARVEDDACTWTRGFFGTPLFASPEQTRGEVTRASSDVFSLGSTACAALSGCAPFGGGMREQVFERIRLRDPVLPAELSADMRAVLERCLAKSARHRYSDASELVADLERLARFEPVDARPIGRVKRMWRRVRREPARFAKLGAVACLLLGCVGALLFATRRGQVIADMVVEAQVAELERQLAAGRLERIEGSLRELPDAPVLASLRGRVALLTETWSDARRYLLRAMQSGQQGRAEQAGYELACAQIEGREPRVMSDLPAPSSGWDHWIDGVSASARGDLAASAQSYARAVQREPANFLWRLTRARTSMLHLRYEAAAADYRALILQKPGDSELLFEACQAIARVSPDEAIAALSARRALESEPVRRDQLDVMHAYLLRERDPQQAIAMLARFYEKDPRDLGLLQAYATALIAAGDWARARSVVAKAREADPASEAIAELSSLVRASETGATVDPGRDQAARRELAKRLLASKVPARQLQGALSMAQSSRVPSEVVRWYRRACAISPEALHPRTELARQLLHQGKSAQAREALGEIPLGKSRQTARSLTVLGMIEVAEKRPEIALGYFTQAFAIDPEDGLVCGELAKAWLLLGNGVIARRWAEAGVACRSYRNFALDAMGRVHESERDWRAAIASYDAALEIAQDVRLELRRANCLAQLGEHENAVELYRGLQARVPSWPDPCVAEGLLRMQSDRSGVANRRLGARILRKAIELEGDPERSAPWREALDRFRRGRSIVPVSDSSGSDEALLLGG